MISYVVLLPQQARQGTVVLDTARVRATELATEVVTHQLRAGVALLVARGLCPIILGDRWSACAPFLTRLADVQACWRVKSNHVISHPACHHVPSRPVGCQLQGWGGVQCKNESSHGDPDEV